MFAPVRHDRTCRRGFATRVGFGTFAVRELRSFWRETIWDMGDTTFLFHFRPTFTPPVDRGRDQERVEYHNEQIAKALSIPPAQGPRREVRANEGFYTQDPDGRIWLNHHDGTRTFAGSSSCLTLYPRSITNDDAGMYSQDNEGVIWWNPAEGEPYEIGHSPHRLYPTRPGFPL